MNSWWSAQLGFDWILLTQACPYQLALLWILEFKGRCTRKPITPCSQYSGQAISWTAWITHLVITGKYNVKLLWKDTRIHVYWVRRFRLGRKVSKHPVLCPPAENSIHAKIAEASQTKMTVSANSIQIPRKYDMVALWGKTLWYLGGWYNGRLLMSVFGKFVCRCLVSAEVCEKTKKRKLDDKKATTIGKYKYEPVLSSPVLFGSS